MSTDNIRNFVIIAHIDHGKSTLADRMLEVTGTIEKRLMRPQYLDQLELERERGITIKMAPVRMRFAHTQILADQDADSRGLLYEDLTYKLRGAFFAVYNKLGPSFKESVYGNALAEEFKKLGIAYEREKTIDVLYDDKKVGVYRPDFVIDGKIILEIKALPFLGNLEKKQTWYYLKGSPYRLAFLLNFGSKELQIERIVYDSIRDDQRLDPRQSAQVEYILNLIDTPGHADFRYEVSRALAAVEGAVLLVDATQGMQAQTLANYESAKRVGLTLIGAVNKIDVATEEQIEEATKELSALLGFSEKDIVRVSGKTGEGVPVLLGAVVERIPAPRSADQRGLATRINADTPKAAVPSRALIFDSLYSDHKGIIAFIRVVNGAFKAEAIGSLLATKTDFKIKELGYFTPQLKPGAILNEGEIGYVATGIKDSDKIRIGDTLLGAADKRGFSPSALIRADVDPRVSASWALPGYTEPKPVVFVTFYPEDADEYEELKKALSKLRLTDASLTFEPDSSEVLGRGFKGGFLGRLHFEITAERLQREFNIATTHSFPSVAYRVRHTRINADGNADKRGLSIRENQRLDPQESASDYEVITNPKDFTGDYQEVEEPITRIEILTPMKWLSSVFELKNLYRLSDIATEHIGGKILITAKLPLADLIRDFDDKLKSVSQGFASLNYELVDWERTDVAKLDVIITEQLVPGLTRILPRKDIEREARITVERLKELLPQAQFSQAIQAASGGRILARETIPAMRKDVTGYLYGGDRTRKMKLWKKQQKGKKRLKEMAGTRSITLPASIFKELLKK